MPAIRHRRRPCKSHVIIDLKGDGLDTELRLYESDSSGNAGDLIAYNDDNPEASGRIDSRLGRHLVPGYYLVEARLKTASHAGMSKTLTLRIDREDFIPHDGAHQKDNTAAYTVVDTLSPFPPEVLHPTRIISDGVAEWNRAAAGAWPHVGSARAPHAPPTTTDT